jgi:hypothetical protein
MHKKYHKLYNMITMKASVELEKKSSISTTGIQDKTGYMNNKFQHNLLFIPASAKRFSGCPT